MRCFKQTDNEYITLVGTGNGGEEITQEEHNEILSAFKSKPPRTETTDYRLREDLTWEEYHLDPPDPDPEISDAELLDILMGGAT